MKKIELLKRLEQIYITSEGDDELYCLAVLDLLLDYVGDIQIREAVDKIALL